jgi:hypothetical protein
VLLPGNRRENPHYNPAIADGKCFFFFIDSWNGFLGSIIFIKSFYFRFKTFKVLKINSPAIKNDFISTSLKYDLYLSNSLPAIV